MIFQTTIIVSLLFTNDPDSAKWTVKVFASIFTNSFQFVCFANPYQTHIDVEKRTMTLPTKQGSKNERFAYNTMSIPAAPQTIYACKTPPIKTKAFHLIDTYTRSLKAPTQPNPVQLQLQPSPVKPVTILGHTASK